MFKISLDKLPGDGLVLAMFKDNTILRPYKVVNGKVEFEGCEILEKEPPRECHFFNEDAEYRLIRREARDDVVEIVLSKDEEKMMDSDLLFEEELLVREEYPVDRLRVINRYMYSDDDTLVLKNYRIAKI